MRRAYPTRDPLWFGFFGRDWARDDGYCLTLLFLPAPTLRRRNEEGMMMLVGFGIRVRFVFPLGPLHLVRAGGRRAWRWPIVLDIHSDAREIGFRRAEAAGHRFPGRRQDFEAMSFDPDERIPL